MANKPTILGTGWLRHGRWGMLALLALALSIFGGSSVAATGNTIRSPDTAGDVGWDTSLALDAAGNPVVSYWDNTNSDLKILHCGTNYCTVGNSITSPDTAGVVGIHPSVRLDALGNPVVSYGDYTNHDLKLLHCGNANCTTGNSISSPDTGGDVGLQSSLALDAAGNPVVSYLDYTNRDLRLLHCGNPNCTAGNSIASPDITGEVGWYSSLTLDAAGNPVVSYYDAANLDLKLLHCGNANCTVGNSITVPDSAGDAGKYSSLALDASGYPVVSYIADYPDYDVKLLHCGDENCAGGSSMVAPDPAGFAGYETSLALDASGNPVVSYLDAANYDLNLLHCGNPNCTAGNGIASPDTEGSVGYFSSVALDASGDPVVSYYDNEYTNRDLKVLHCGNADCTASPKDADADGCPDTNEQNMVPGSEFTGGLRDYQNPYDYFNPSGDGQNRIDDVLAVVRQYFIDDSDGNPGFPPYALGYNPDTDRRLLGPDPWDTGPPNGQQRVDDIVFQLSQYFHDCA